MSKVLRIGTRESQLAVWQAELVKSQLAQNNIESELVFIKSEGDIDLVTPLYEIGVQGIFTKTLDAALLSRRIDLAVHSMKDVPVQLAKGIVQAAVLKRASYKDILVYKNDTGFLNEKNSVATIATSSIRRKAQWLHQYPNHTIENLRGNVNTRLQKVKDNNWNGAIFAAAGVERINVRPENSIDITWMLPAPAQGAIMIVCNEDDAETKAVCASLNDETTAACTKIERDFLKTLMGGCSTPISALAEIENDKIHFKGNIFSLDGTRFLETERLIDINNAITSGIDAAKELLNRGADKITAAIRNAII
ncbi:hydroxymethylbilane synthase [Panacibacter ginsenosidivorans]|uniref:Hydroxymethylbilane synthase n=1 Tax=Panacibacter ginsenosidivorans TaxID=1813871 RepID=A0A5B8VEJ5_9BACT|nr:hydroxymethylbilane synthase [Panacibacter ginsenosidivorans]QEC68698.1 hydroxymethylbilane synthase [Panacibacter ginsenosidivorans]